MAAFRHPARNALFGRRLAAVTLALLLCSAPQLLAGVEEGLAAVDAGDYEAALPEFWGPAAAGDAEAQTLLTFLYDEGLGVAADHREAAKWYLRAASQGDGIAQLNIGIMYADSDGIAQDYVQAFVWFSRAEKNFPGGEALDQARRNRELAGSLLTLEQKRRADALLAGPPGKES